VHKRGSLHVAATGVQSACPLPNASGSSQQNLSLTISLQNCRYIFPLLKSFSSCKTLRDQLIICMRGLLLPFSFIFSFTCATCSAYLTPRHRSLITLIIYHTALVQPALSKPLVMTFCHCIYHVKFSIFLSDCLLFLLVAGNICN
jgi:hypothetical protein